MRKTQYQKSGQLGVFYVVSILAQGQPPRGPLVVSPEIHVFRQANLNRHKGTKTRRKTSEICGFVS